MTLGQNDLASDLIGQGDAFSGDLDTTHTVSPISGVTLGLRIHRIDLAGVPGVDVAPA
jgi:hypothetical protein